MKFDFIILEQDGKIDTETRDLPLDAGFTYAGRFLNLFKDDPYKRVVRISIEGEPFATFDSEKGLLSFGSKTKKGAVKI